MLALPLFLCQHLPNDAAYYDVQARLVLDGGVLYRDAVEPNLPGVVWIHMLVRTLFGWSTVALRAFDIVVLAGTAVLLVLWNRVDRSQPLGLRAPLLCLAIFWYHFSLTEWCHCQRDGWMLLPALGALFLRDWNLGRTARGEQSWVVFSWSVLEGTLWGAAFWIKPHVAVPALFTLGASLMWGGWSRRMQVSFLGILVGGLCIGGAGSAWLIGSGTWPYFWDMQLHWNPEYLAKGREQMSLDRLRCFFFVFTPWTWAELIALPFAVVTLNKSLKKGGTNRACDPCDPLLLREQRRNLLMSALFLGWITQALLIQYPFAYVQSPPVVLALAIVAGLRWRPDLDPIARFAYGFTFLIAALSSPATEPGRLANWWDCVTQGPTPQVRANIQFEKIPYWHDLPPVMSFLRERGVSGHDVMVYDAGLVVLYNELNLSPPTRYVYADVHARLFQSRTDQIHEAFEKSPHRYVVSSLLQTNVQPEDLGDNDPRTGLPKTLSPRRLSQYPFTQPVIFRSGWYVVHEVQHPIGPLCTEAPEKRTPKDPAGPQLSASL